MHPALSVIAFTVASGLGYGLAAVLGLGLLDPAAISTKAAHVVALFLIGGGLLSSTLHLHNRQRAWRALSQWRTSWLSREGVLAILTFLPLLWAAWATIVGGRHAVLPGLAGSLLALATVWCTGMIYASLRSVQAWATVLTPVCYILFSLSGGVIGAIAIASFSGRVSAAAAAAAILLLAVAWGTKLAWRNRMLTIRATSTPETATGLGTIGKVRLFEAPHTNDNYLTREMGFRIARKHARKLALISLLAGGVLPAVLLAIAALSDAGATASVSACAALLIHGAGMLVERWLFFAEARHAVANYYGR